MKSCLGRFTENDCASMVALALLAEASGIVMLADVEREYEEIPGYLDFYSYEPLADVVAVLNRVVDAVAQITTYSRWELRLFGNDGSLTCWKDGRELDDAGDPIVGTNALKSYANMHPPTKDWL